MCGRTGLRLGLGWACSKRLNPLPAHTLFQDGRAVGRRARQGGEGARTDWMDEDPTRADRRQGFTSDRGQGCGRRCPLGGVVLEARQNRPSRRWRQQEMMPPADKMRGREDEKMSSEWARERASERTQRRPRMGSRGGQCAGIGEIGASLLAPDPVSRCCVGLCVCGLAGWRRTRWMGRGRGPGEGKQDAVLCADEQSFS